VLKLQATLLSLDEVMELLSVRTSQCAMEASQLLIILEHAQFQVYDSLRVLTTYNGDRVYGQTLSLLMLKVPLLYQTAVTEQSYSLTHIHP